jgi:UrcA family protein
MTMNTLIRNMLIGTLAASTLAWTAPVSAEEPGPSITVHFGDLNINNPQGAEALYRRIQNAARKVCWYDNDSALPGYQRTCFKNAVADAVAKVNSAPLNAVHMRKVGGPAQG